MPATKAQQKAVNKYRKNNYALIQLTMSKEYKEQIKARAEALGLSVNGYIKSAIAEKIAREGGEQDE